jgi:hypothetical protein
MKRLYTPSGSKATFSAENAGVVGETVRLERLPVLMIP